MKRITTAFAAMCFATASFAGPFDGVYSGGDGPMACDEQWAQSDGGPMIIENNKFYGVETECDLTNPTNLRGIDGILYDAACASEGEISTLRMLFVRSSNGIFMTSSGYTRELKSCG